MASLVYDVPAECAEDVAHNLRMAAAGSVTRTDELQALADSILEHATKPFSRDANKMLRQQAKAALAKVASELRIDVHPRALRNEAFCYLFTHSPHGTIVCGCTLAGQDR